MRISLSARVAILAALVFGACGGSGDGSPNGGLPTGGPLTEPPASPAAAPTVVAQNTAFAPNAVSVAAGSAVTWENADTVQHTATHGTGGNVHGSALFDLPLPPGERVSYTFDEAGSFPVTCTIHPQMQMEVTVTP